MKITRTTTIMAKIVKKVAVFDVGLMLTLIAAVRS